jgi:hypothetical protein
MANAIIPRVVAPKRQTFDGCKRQDGQAIVLNKKAKLLSQTKNKNKTKAFGKKV